MGERLAWIVLAGLLTGYLGASWIDDRAERTLGAALHAEGVVR